MGRMCCFNAFDFFMGKNFVFGCDENHFFVYLRRNSSKDRELIPSEISGGEGNSFIIKQLYNYKIKIIN